MGGRDSENESITYKLSAAEEDLNDLNESSVALSLPESFDASYFQQFDNLASTTTKMDRRKITSSGPNNSCSK
jgi:hypothetical protein